MALMSSSSETVPQDLIEQVRAASATRQPLRIVGGDTKSFYGAPAAGDPLEMTGWQGIVSHEPTELVVTVRAGTPLAELEAALAETGQRFTSAHGDDRRGGSVAREAFPTHPLQCVTRRRRPVKRFHDPAHRPPWWARRAGRGHPF